MKEKYKHLLFDLDHTLWDFESNCTLTLKELFSEYDLSSKNISLELFCSRFLKINSEVWSLYDKNQITKEELREYRFRKLLLSFGQKDDILSLELETKYLERCPKKGILMPNAMEILELTQPNFNLCFITNGFQSTQEEKVNFSALKKLSLPMFSSEFSGHKKPDKKYFDHVLDALNAEKEQCLVIGDNPHTDVQGAKNAGLDCLWINTQNFPKRISCNYYVRDLATAIKLFS